MMQTSEPGCRHAWLDDFPARLLAPLLDAVGESQALLEASLRFALTVLGAERGVAFDTRGTLAAQGFGLEEAAVLRDRRLAGLRAGGPFVRLYSLPCFAAPAEAGAPVVGMAGLILTPPAVFVFAAERESVPFLPDETAELAQVLCLLRVPLQQTAELQRAKRELEAAARKLRLRDFPFERLEPLPQLHEIERMLIQEALARAKNNKTRAAAALGMTREGLRKKMNRFRMA